MDSLPLNQSCHHWGEESANSNVHQQQLWETTAITWRISLPVMSSSVSRMTFPNRQHTTGHISERMITTLAICQGPLSNHTRSPLSVSWCHFWQRQRKHFPPSAQRWRPFGDLLTMIMLVMISADISPLEEMSRSKIKCQSPIITTALQTRARPQHQAVFFCGT